MEYCSVIKKNEILPFATTWIDPECIILSEASQRQILYDLHAESKNNINELTKQKQTHRHRKQTYGYQEGKGERNKLGIWD